MKSSRPLHSLMVGVTLALLLPLAACSLSTTADPPATSAATDTAVSPAEYEALIAQLREELLHLKGRYHHLYTLQYTKQQLQNS